jgi:hypothetical protein
MANTFASSYPCEAYKNIHREILEVCKKENFLDEFLLI